MYRLIFIEFNFFYSFFLRNGGYNKKCLIKNVN